MFCPILVEMPSLVHSTLSTVYWISFAAGISFQVPRKVFFSMAPDVVDGAAVYLDTFTEEDVERGNAGKVKDVNAVPDGHLRIMILLLVI